MISYSTQATLVDPASLDVDALLTATFERADLDALVGSGEPPQLWLELTDEREEPRQVTLRLTDADLEALLSGADGEELTLALDATALADLLEEPDVEAHGLRAGIAIAIAVVAGAVAAPSALGATQQVSPATKPQVTEQQIASQQVGSATARQVVPQVTRQVVRSQLHSGRTSPVKFGQLSVLRAGAVR